MQPQPLCLERVFHVFCDRLPPSQPLPLPFEPAYRSNLDKLVQMEAVMADLVEADRKKREKRAQDKEAAAATTTTPSES